LAGFITWIVVGVVVLLILAFLVSGYNRIIRLDNQIDNAWSQIDVQLKRRADLIPNLVETVKGYAKHEREVLENVTRARAALMGATTPQGAVEADNVLTGALKSLFAVAERYPDLKANQNFLQLQDELTHTENKVSFARQSYNDTVLAFNNAVTTFPGNVFASFMAKSKRQMLQVPPESREVPKVSF
jgi:LemA protein